MWLNVTQANQNNAAGQWFPSGWVFGDVEILIQGLLVLYSSASGVNCFLHDCGVILAVLS